MRGTPAGIKIKAINDLLYEGKTYNELALEYSLHILPQNIGGWASDRRVQEGVAEYRGITLEEVKKQRDEFTDYMRKKARQTWKATDPIERRPLRRVY